MSGINRVGNVQADITRSTGRHLLTRQPLTLATNVPLNGPIISNLKQHLPVFRAIELTSLNQRFGKTEFDEQTVDLWLTMNGDNDNLVTVTLKDGRKPVPKWYKGRQHTVPMDAVGDLLKKITCEDIIRTLYVRASDSLLEALLPVEKLSPVRLILGISAECHKDNLVAFMKRLADTGKMQLASVSFNPQDINWELVEQCLAQFTSLQHLWLWTNSTNGPLPPSACLKNAVEANSQLKQLKFDSRLLLSPVVSSAISTMMACISDIEIRGFTAEELLGHVDVDLCGGGQSTLTKLALEMPQTGHLKLEIGIDDDDFSGDLLRLAYYLLSLHRTGLSVVVKREADTAEWMQEFVEDLANFYFPLTQTEIGTGGSSYQYRVSMGNVTIDLYAYEDDGLYVDEGEEN